VANLTGGHTGKIFCVGFDSKKVFLLKKYRLECQSCCNSYLSDRILRGRPGEMFERVSLCFVADLGLSEDMYMGFLVRN